MLVVTLSRAVTRMSMMLAPTFKLRSGPGRPAATGTPLTVIDAPASAGAAVDLALLPRRSFTKEAGRSVNRLPEYPGPPFPFHKPDDEKYRNLSEAETKQMEEEWDNLATQPFSLIPHPELIRASMAAVARRTRSRGTGAPAHRTT